MRFRYPYLLVFCLLTVHGYAQDEPIPVTVHIGDTPPPLHVKAWLKGAPIQQFEKGQVYVVEFWGTWCKPCRAAIPHLSALADKYRGKVTVIGIDALEAKNVTIEKVKAFVDSMGNRMNYSVAVDDSTNMLTSWLRASGEKGFPGSIVVNGAGRVAWMGHPMYLDEVLPDIVNNTWDIQEALAKLNRNRYLDSLDEEASYIMLNYEENIHKPGVKAKPDLGLLAIDSIVKSEPGLKYAPRMAYATFRTLLKTDMQKAYAYGKAAIATPVYTRPAFQAIIDVIRFNIDQLPLPPAIYRLGAEAYQAYIDWVPYPEIVSIHKDYNNMADWYARANDKPKAIRAVQKAIESLKSKKDYTQKELATLEARLQEYRKR